jgi:hypothetical protein
LSDFIGKPISLQSEGAMSQEQYDIVLLWTVELGNELKVLTAEVKSKRFL